VENSAVYRKGMFTRKGKILPLSCPKMADLSRKAKRNPLGSRDLKAPKKRSGFAGLHGESRA
jgi:hypothetical protein